MLIIELFQSIESTARKLTKADFLNKKIPEMQPENTRTSSLDSYPFKYSRRNGKSYLVQYVGRVDGINEYGYIFKTIDSGGYPIQFCVQKSELTPV
jgi:hypothetical protein